jgi:excinuclease UvrABC nuclease subunit
MKRFLIAGIAAVALAGCAANGSGQQVDYSQLAQNACGLATSEIAALQSVQSDMSAKDQAVLAEVAPKVATVCEAVNLATASPQVTWQTVTAALTQITVLIATYHPTSGVSA